MKYEEKLKFKKEILEEIRECMFFNGEDYVLYLSELDKKIQRYEAEIKGIQQYLEHSTSK